MIFLGFQKRGLLDRSSFLQFIYRRLICINDCFLYHVMRMHFIVFHCLINLKNNKNVKKLKHHLDFTVVFTYYEYKGAESHDKSKESNRG